MISTYFKERLHQGLAQRFKDLDYVNVVYHQGGWDGQFYLIQAQVGRTTDDLMLESGSALQAFTRDYFIFQEDLYVANGQPYSPLEGDIIYDSMWKKQFCRVSSLGSTRTTYRYTDETNRRLRVHTTVMEYGSETVDPVPDIAATWIRSDAVPVSHVLVRAINYAVSTDKLEEAYRLIKGVR